MTKVQGEGYISLYVTSVLMGISWVTVLMRIWVRVWKKILGLDDYLMVAGLILYTVTACLVIVCCFYGSGQKAINLQITDIQYGTKLFFIAEFFYASCTVPIKGSICVTLLRIADARRRFVWTLWAVMTLVSISAVVFIAAIANICHPITDLWGETTGGTCNPTLNSNVSFFFSAISILTDWTLAILPGLLLYKVQMRARVKWSVAVMLGLAAFASCATIVRLRYLTLYNNSQEFMYSTGAIGLWSIIEESIGIIAGSMPALRPLLNLPIFGSNSSYPSGDNSKHPSAQLHSSPPGNGSNHWQENSVKMDTFKASAAAYNPQKSHSRGSVDDDGDSQKQILKHTQVSVVAESGADEDWRRQQVLGWENK